MNRMHMRFSFPAFQGGWIFVVHVSNGGHSTPYAEKVKKGQPQDLSSSLWSLGHTFHVEGI